jgi:hypothetical protein
MATEHEILSRAFTPTTDGAAFRYLVDGDYAREVNKVWKEFLAREGLLRREPFPRRF